MKSTTFALVAAAIPFAFAAPFEKREGYEAVFVTDLKLTTVTTQLTVYYTGQPAAATVYTTPAAAPAAAPTDAPEVDTYVAPVAAAIADTPAPEVVTVQPESVIEQPAASTADYTPTVSPAEVQAPAAPVAPATVDTSLDSYAQEMLAATNKWRAEFQAAPLTWDASMADKAYTAAQQCSYLHLSELAPKDSGQNLAWGATSATGACDLWGAEYSKYDWQNPDWHDGIAGHFSALVWQGSTSVGCAVYDCGGKMGPNTVCNYYPAGNMGGGYAANVLPKAY